MKRMLVTIIMLFCMTQEVKTQKPGDVEWINKYYKSTLSTLFPIERESGIHIGFRSHQDLYPEVLEYSFILGREYNEDGVRIIVRMADSMSIYYQLMQLHRQNPSTSIASLQPKLKIKEWRLTEKSCPAITSRFDDFYKIKFMIPNPDLVTMHPLVCEFYVGGISGRMHLTSFDEFHPIVSWALGTRKEIEGCLRKASSEEEKKK